MAINAPRKVGDSRNRENSLYTSDDGDAQRRQQERWKIPRRPSFSIYDARRLSRWSRRRRKI